MGKPSPRSLRNKFIDGIRTFNKHVFNHLTLALAESGLGPFSIICHTGRKSGRAYRTPVMATYIGETIIIPLSYGEQVDWLRNILAQGGCEMVHQRKRIRAINPQVVGSDAALALLPEKRARVFARFKLEKFLQMQFVS
ncbi:MAG: nitroreductase family deazaflavin-dependent oxidoreductase [Anaerolineales bacterium]|nr:nitroreductase family deazaflavin-dependent oxidoreductase [Anaerolineales bacterium]